MQWGLGVDSLRKGKQKQNGIVGKEGLGGRDTMSQTGTNQEIGSEFSFCMQRRNEGGKTR